MKVQRLLPVILLVLPAAHCGPKRSADATVRALAPETENRYVVRTPDGYDPSRQYPLVVALHGLNKSELQATSLWNEGFFYMPDFILVSVRGPFKSSGGYTWFGACRDPEIPPDRRHLAAALTCEERILDVVDEVEQQYSVDPARRIVMGFSMGSAIAYFAALRNPDKFTGLADMGGRPYQEITPEITADNAGTLSAFISMGTEESDGAVRASEKMADQLRRAGARVVYNTPELGHVISATEMRTFQNFFGLSLEHAPEDDYTYDADGQAKLSGGPPPDDYESDAEYDDFYEEPAADDEPGYDDQ